MGTSICSRVLRLSVVAAVVLGICSVSQAGTLVAGNQTATVNVPVLSPEAGGIGIISHIVNVGSVTEDVLENVDDDLVTGYGSWFWLGDLYADVAGSRGAVPIEDYSGDANAAAVGSGTSKLTWSYGQSAGSGGAHAGTTVAVQIELLDKPLDSHEGTMIKRTTIRNTGAASKTYSLVYYSDIALTNVIGAGFVASALERLVVSGGRNQIITQTDYAGTAGDPLEIGKNVHTVYESTVRAPGDAAPVSGDNLLSGDGLITTAGDLATYLTNAGTSDISPGGDPLRLFSEADFNRDNLVTTAGDLADYLTNAGQDLNSDYVQVHEDASGLIADFIENAAVNLNDATSVEDSAGTGDTSGRELAFAQQFNVLVQPGKAFIIEEVIRITPEPASMALLGLGMTILVGRRARRR